MEKNCASSWLFTKKKLLYSILTTILHSDERCAADEVTAAVVKDTRFGI